MRPEFVAVQVLLDDTPGEDSEGAPLLLPEICVDHTLQVSGTFTTTDLRAEVSNDGVSWVELDAFTGPEIAVYEDTSFRMLRIRTETFGPGDEPAVRYGGFNVRVES